MQKYRMTLTSPVGKIRSLWTDQSLIDVVDKVLHDQGYVSISFKTSKGRVSISKNMLQNSLILVETKK